VARQEKRMDDALRWCAESMTMYLESGSRPQIARCFELLASIWCTVPNSDAQRLSQASRLLGAADRLRELLGFPLPPSEQPDIQGASDACRTALGDAGFEAEWSKGRASIDSAGWAAVADEAMRALS
jgi:hypothetical protein